MNQLLREFEADFGTTIAMAAEKIGHMGQANKIPARDVYGIVVHAALLFAATMSHRHMTRTEFVVMCEMVFDGMAERQTALTATDRE